MKVRRYHRVLSAFLVTVIILTTILAFPTPGLSLKANMNASKVSYSLGEVATFTPEILLGLDEVKHIKSVTLVIDGPQPQSHVLPVIPGTYTNVPGLAEVVVEWKNIGIDPGTGYGYKGLAAPSSIKYTIKKKLPIYLDPRPKGHPADLPVVTKLFDHQPLSGASYLSTGVTVDPGTGHEWVVRDVVADSFFDIFIEVNLATPTTPVKTVKLPSAEISDATWLGTNPWVMDNAETWSDPIQFTDHFSSFNGITWSLQLTSVAPLRPGAVLYDVDQNGVAGCEDIDLTNNGQAWPACVGFDVGSGQVALSLAAHPGDHVTATYQYTDLVLPPGARKLDVSVASGNSANILKSVAVPPDGSGRRQAIGGLAIGGGNVYFASAETPEIFVALESSGSPVGVVQPWGNYPLMPPPAWEALAYYNNALYGAYGNTVYKIDLAGNKEITGRWETTIPNITGLAVHNDELFVEGSYPADGAGAEYTAGIPGVPPINDTAEGDYNAKLRVVYAEDNNDQVDSNVVNFSVEKLSTVNITIDKPADNQVFAAKTIAVEGKTSPGITQVTISRPLKDEPLDQSDFESGVGQWTKVPATNNLWNLTTEKSKSATHSWWYGQKTGQDLNYNVLDQFGSPVANSGALVGPSLKISGPTSVSWWMYWNTKPGFWADWKLVTVKHGATTDNLAIVDDLDPTKTGAALQPGDACTTYSLGELQAMLNPNDPTYGNIQMAIGSLQSFDPDVQNLVVAPQKSWTKCSLKLDAYAGQTIQVGFAFNTVTNWDNMHDGWFIDDTLVIGKAVSTKTANVAADATFATTFDIEEGSNAISVRGTALPTGPAGPFTGVTSATVFLDTLAPVCILDAMPQYTNNAVQRVKGKCSDVNPSSLAIKVNGSPVFSKATGLTTGDSFFDVFVNLAEGVNTIDAILTDRATHEGKATLTTTLDTTGPVISNTLTTAYPVGQKSTRPGSSTRPGDPVIFQLTVTDIGSSVDRVWVTVPGQSGPQELDFMKSSDMPQAVIAQWGTTGNYVFPYQLPGGTPSGTYTLTVKARDKGGNISTSTVWATVVATLEAFNIYFMPGQNLFSTPLIPNDANIENLMVAGLGVTGSDQAAKVAAMRAKGLETVWYYNAAESDPNKRWMKWDTDPGSPDNLATIDPGKGYWATWDKTKFSYSAPLRPGQQQTPAPVKLTIEGTVFIPGKTSMPTYDVFKGWNLVGMHSENPLPASTYLDSLKVGGNAIWSSLHQYLNLIDVNRQEATFGAFERLIGSDTMQPGRGFWLYTESGTIAP